MAYYFFLHLFMKRLENASLMETIQPHLQSSPAASTLPCLPHHACLTPSQSSHLFEAHHAPRWALTSISMRISGIASACTPTTV